jgi:hypothetical protein
LTTTLTDHGFNFIVHGVPDPDHTVDFDGLSVTHGRATGIANDNAPIDARYALRRLNDDQ